MEKENKNILRIALIGPESTSKSTLSQELANHYQTTWVAEYARAYLKNINRKYTCNDILIIAQEQLRQEETLLKTANKFIFVDTELIVAKVWCLDVFESCPTWISNQITTHPYDLYLLTYPDLPWQEDPMRENPHRRMFLYNWYKNELKKINANYAIIKGFNDERLQNAIAKINNFFNNYQK